MHKGYAKASEGKGNQLMQAEVECRTRFFCKVAVTHYDNDNVIVIVSRVVVRTLLPWEISVDVGFRRRSPCNFRDPGSLYLKGVPVMVALYQMYDTDTWQVFINLAPGIRIRKYF